MTSLVERDERTLALENASYRWAYLFVSFGLLAITAYRSFAFKETSWDLLALVVGSGVVSTVYQATQRSLARRWWLAAALSIAAALLVGLMGNW